MMANYAGYSLPNAHVFLASLHNTSSVKLPSILLTALL